MLDDERRNNFSLRLSIDKLKNIIELLEQDKTPTKEQIQFAKEDINNMVEAITNYHARFIELLETVNNIKEIEKRLNFESK